MIVDQKLLKQIVGVYLIDSDIDGTQLATSRKPNFFQVFMMRILLGWKWLSIIDLKKKEVEKKEKEKLAKEKKETKEKLAKEKEDAKKKKLEAKEKFAKEKKDGDIKINK